MTHFVQRKSQYTLVVGCTHDNHQALLRDFLGGEHRRPVSEIIHAYDIDISTFLTLALPLKAMHSLIRSIAFDMMYRVHGVVDLSGPIDSGMTSRAWIIVDKENKIVLSSEEHAEKTRRDGYIAEMRDDHSDEMIKDLIAKLGISEEEYSKMGCEEIPA